MDLEALHIKRELLYREAREIHEQRLKLDRSLHEVTGVNPLACQRRSLLQAEFDDLTIQLRALSSQIRVLTQQIDTGLSHAEIWSSETI